MRRGFRPYSFYARIVVPETPLEQTEAGLVAAGVGWFVVNAREARWLHREGRGELLPLTGNFETDDDAEWHRVLSFPQFGVNLFVLEPGEPMAVYHGEDAQEDFLVLRGDCALVVEGQERALKEWDFVHCPPWTEHTIVGAGDGACVSSQSERAGARGFASRRTRQQRSTAPRWNAIRPTEARRTRAFRRATTRGTAKVCYPSRRPTASGASGKSRPCRRERRTGLRRSPRTPPACLLRERRRSSRRHRSASSAAGRSR